jgi:hypothetical protein
MIIPYTDPWVSRSLVSFGSLWIGFFVSLYSLLVTVIYPLTSSAPFSFFPLCAPHSPTQAIPQCLAQRPHQRLTLFFFRSLTLYCGLYYPSQSSSRQSPLIWILLSLPFALRLYTIPLALERSRGLLSNAIVAHWHTL